MSKKTIALLDVDDTLLFDNGINRTLIERLKRKGITDLYLFSNFNPRGDVLASVMDYSHITRQGIIEILEDEGLSVQGMVCQYDKYYKDGRAKAGELYQDLVDSGLYQERNENDLYEAFNNRDQEEGEEIDLLMKPVIEQSNQDDTLINDHKRSMMTLLLPDLLRVGYTDIVFYDDRQENLAGVKEVIDTHNSSYRNKINYKGYWVENENSYHYTHHSKTNPNKFFASKSNRYFTAGSAIQGTCAVGAGAAVIAGLFHAGTAATLATTFTLSAAAASVTLSCGIALAIGLAVLAVVGIALVAKGFYERHKENKQPTFELDITLASKS